MEALLLCVCEKLCLVCFNILLKIPTKKGKKEGGGEKTNKPPKTLEHSLVKKSASSEVSFFLELVKN